MTRPDTDPDLPELDRLEEERLGALLRHAFAPSEIDPARHEQLLEAALEDPFAPASASEIAESERLRQALDGAGDHAHLTLARALSAAYGARAASPTVEPSVVLNAASRPSRQVIYYRFGAAVATLAAAAAILLSVTGSERRAPAPDLPSFALAQSRSTAPLFRADPAPGASTRIDRIASVRGRELRDNRYALWGVR